MAEENEFPTITDARDVLAELVKRGLGELPVQILIVPDSTLQSIAKVSGEHDPSKPALMIDYTAQNGRLAFPLVSMRWVTGGGMPTTETQ